jgi:hypothetical protein
MDLRKYNGAIKGENRGQGRKPKSSEVELIERLSPMEDTALDALKAGIERGDFNFIKLFFEYRFGKAKQFNVDLLSEETIIRIVRE